MTEYRVIKPLMPFVTYTLILLNVFIFIIQNIFPLITLQYAMVPAEILAGQNLYALVTSVFLHADIIHIFMNMYFLFLFGTAVEREIHPIAFILLFIFAGIIGNLGHIFITLIIDSFLPLYGIYIPTIGASGAIFGIMAAYAYIMPRRPMSVYGYSDSGRTYTAWNFIIIYFILEVVSIFISIGSSIAHGAHVFGFLGGLAFALIYQQIRQTRAKQKVEDEYDNYTYYA